MARGKLWSVKGVSPEAREAAKAAAQNSDQPIGVWIDQAILMSGDDESQDEDIAAPSSDEISDVDIVAILQALEARVGDHADRITEQLGPVRDSISELGERLQRLEHKQSNTPTEPVSNTSPGAPQSTSPPEAPPETEEPTPERAPEPEPETSTHDPVIAEAEDTSDSPAAPAPDLTEPHAASANPSEARARIDPANITEADIHAADAALKSELTGLFDDGAHRQNATLNAPPNDPFMPRRPKRRSSRAPLVFVLAILLAAVAGVAAVAWFEFLSPEMRRSLTTDLFSEIDGAESQDLAQTPQPVTPEPSPPKAKISTPSPVDAQPAAPQPPAPLSTAASDPTPPAPTTPTPPSPAPVSANTTPPIAAEPEPELDTTDAAVAIARGTTGNAELDALREDASIGVATAQNELGVRYLVGRGVAKDYGEAAFWLRKAAAQDMTNAQYNLGVLYESGRGVESDPTEALIWFHSAAENGHGRAQMAVAAAYASGRGITRNPDEALKWLRLAAESNVAEAQFSLGNILATSPASREGLTDAYYWYQIADANGMAKASERSDQVSAQLTPEERAGVNARVSHFISQKIPRAPKSPTSTSAPARTTPSAIKPEAPPARAPAAAPAVSTTASVDSVSQDQINAIQTLLNQLGFDTGRPDGTVGNKTRDAIRNYQRELGLPVDGTPSLALLNHLRQIAGNR